MIRSLTIGLPIGTQPPLDINNKINEFIVVAQDKLRKMDLTPRTVRFTLPPMDINGEVEGVIRSTLSWVDKLAHDNNVRWYCMPLDLVSEGVSRERLISSLDALSKYPKLFTNLIVADKRGISIEGIKDASSFIINVSKKSNNGFDNFRVGVSANCPANAPFFPFSRHEGNELAFSFALETTSIALEILNTKKQYEKLDLSIIRESMISKLTSTLRQIDSIGKELSDLTGIDYRGVDASFAPLPGTSMSVGSLIEKILGAPVGSQGSVFVTTVLTDIIRAALNESGALGVGFNGVMFSVLEDENLAASNNRRLISIEGLTALSAVCGCGIDMVPIPGISFKEEIAAVMLDIAGLSSTLNKPLGVRMLPIPNKNINEFTDFNFDFLCDSRVLALTPNDHSIMTNENPFPLKVPLKSTKGL